MQWCIMIYSWSKHSDIKKDKSFYILIYVLKATKKKRIFSSVTLCLQLQSQP